MLCLQASKALYLILFMLVFHGVKAQVSEAEKSTINSMLPQPMPKSPNVASLGKFGDYPVNYFSGVPEISIPIFEVTSGELSVPITLSYHASGIKPSDVASWVGLGWNLSAGGNVSRNVIGKPDEQDFYTRTVNTNPDPCTDFNYLKQSALSIIDTEPDVFSYSVPGMSGKFMLLDNGTPYLIPYSPIIVNTQYVSNAFKKFEITDQQGVLHRFGTSSDLTTSQEFTSTVSGGNPSLSATTAWHLMEMTAPNSDDQIAFSYQDAGMCTMYDVSYYVTVQSQCNGDLQGSCPDPTIIPHSASITTAVNQQAVSTITYKKGKVEFVLGGLRNDQTQLKFLDHINIYSLANGQYALVKTVKFVYSYFKNAQNLDARLKLDDLQFLDNTGALIQHYQFSYFTDSFSWDGSNGNFPNARDLWGYYNGALQNTDLILQRSVYVQPNINQNGVWTNVGGAINRTVNKNYSKEGVLQRIDFPTGGYTQFDFEPNQYYNYFNAPGTPTLAGGLRVKSITSSDGGDAPPVVKTYVYGNNVDRNSGIGTANFSQYSYNYNSVQSVAMKACSADMASYSYMSTTYYSASAYNTDNFDSSPVIYPYVTEYYGDPADVTIGRVEYEYDNGFPQTDNDQFVPPSSKYYRQTYFWKRGRLTHKTTYSVADVKTAETIIAYQGIHVADKIIGLGSFQYNLYLGPYCDFAGGCTTQSGDYINPQDYHFTGFSQQSGAWLELSTTSYSYNDKDLNNYVMTQTTKTYDPAMLQVLQTTASGSNNDQVVTVHKYPFQLTSNASSTGNARGVQMLINKNMIATPVESYTYRQNTDGSNARIISGQVTTFRQNNTNTNYVVPDKIYIWESEKALSNTVYTSVVINGANDGLIMDSHYNERINMKSYDSYGNVLTVSKTNDVPTSYVYGYNHLVPIAEINNALSNNIFHTSFEEDIVNIVREGKTGLQSSSAGLLKSLAGLDPGSYVLSYYQKQGVVWAQVSTTVTVSASGNYLINLSGQIDEVRFYPQGAQMTTHTYDPLLGMTSTTDPNGVTTTYVYDSIGRIMSVKDNDQNLLKLYKYNFTKP